MFDERGLPPYPPAQNAWSYPPPPVGRRWKWIAIATSVLSIAVAATLATIAVTLGSRDSTGLIQDDRLLQVIGDECAVMRSTVESMPVRGPLADQASIVHDQDIAVRRMLRHIRSVGSDVIAADLPTADWLADWDQLVDAREAYADGIRAGRPPLFRIPTDSSGRQTYARMGAAVLDGSCDVPFALLSPYPHDEGDEV